MSLHSKYHHLTEIHGSLKFFNWHVFSTSLGVAGSFRKQLTVKLELLLKFND